MKLIIDYFWFDLFTLLFTYKSFQYFFLVPTRLNKINNPICKFFRVKLSNEIKLSYFDNSLKFY